MRKSEGKEPVAIGTGECTRETDRAILVELAGAKDEFGGGGSREVWIPKACLHDDSEVYEMGGDGEVIVFRWFAEKEGLDK